MLALIQFLFYTHSHFFTLSMHFLQQPYQHHIKNKFIQSQFAECLAMRGNNAGSVLGIAYTPHPPEGIPFLYLVSVIKNIMMNSFFFLQMNNLKELAADEMNNCIFVLTTFCGEPYHSHAQLNVHVFFRCLQTGASGRLSLYAFDLKVLFHHGSSVEMSTFNQHQSRWDICLYDYIHTLRSLWISRVDNFNIFLADS